MMAEHGVYALIIAVLSSQMQIKFANSSPYETHNYGLFYTFVASLLLYGAASVYRMQLCAERSPGLLLLATYARPLGGAVSVLVPLFILELNGLAWIVSAVFPAFFAKVCYDSRFCLLNCIRIVSGYILSKWKKLVELCKMRKHPVLSTTLPV